MKTSKFYLAFTAMAFAAIVFVVSCKKSTTTDSDTTSASDSNTAETTSDDVTNMSGQSSESSNGSFRSANVATITVVSSTGAATIVHDTAVGKIAVTFTASVTCADGHTRSGTLNISCSPKGAYYRTPGFTMNVTSSNYVDNGNSIEVHKSVTNTTNGGKLIGFNPATMNETWVVVDTNTITKAGGGTIKFNSTKTVTLLNTNTAYHSALVPISWDSANVSISGTATITDSEGETFTVTIPTTTPLVREYTCTPLSSYPAYHPFSSGSFNFTPPGKAERLISFDGKCDNTVTVTIDGIAYSVTQ